MQHWILCFVVLTIPLFSDCRFSYEGYKVYRAIPKTLDEAKVLHEFENDENVDFWSEMRSLDAPVDIMVSPVSQQRFEVVLKNQDIEYSVLIDNVEEKVQEEDSRQRRSTRVTPGNVSFVEYMRYDDILAYLDQMATTYPDIATTEVIGRSFEGRPLTLIKISSGGTNKPIIFAESAIHAREWIAPPVSLYIINQLLENPENSAYYQDIDWIILPVVNPDGYEFSHDNTRLWRKTRSPGTICHGTDGNRNYDFNWMVIGASSWQCSETYAGHSAFSEPETQAVRDYILAHRENIKLFLDIHSYGQWLLYPWGHTTTPPENAEQLQSVGDRVNDAIYGVRGTNYSVGNSNILLYATSGSSPDYVKGVAGVALTYTVELPAGGSAGFNPDATNIQPVVTETWEGIRVFYEYIADTYVNATVVD